MEVTPVMFTKAASRPGNDPKEESLAAGLRAETDWLSFTKLRLKPKRAAFKKVDENVWVSSTDANWRLVRWPISVLSKPSGAWYGVRSYMKLPKMLSLSESL